MGKKIALVLLIITITATSIFLPIKVLTHNFKVSNLKTNSAHLSLLNERNVEVVVTFPCTTATDEPNWITEFFGGPAFKVQANSEEVLLFLGHKDLKQVKEFIFKRSKKVEQADCKEKLIYSYTNRTVKYLSSNEETIYKITSPYEVQVGRVIQINPDLKESEVKVEIKNETKRPQNTINYILLILTISILFLVNFQNLSNGLSIKLSKKNIVLPISSLFFLSLISIFTLPRGDDGWYLLMNKYYEITGNYDNYAFPSPRPSGYLFNLVNSFLSQFNIIIVTRLLAIICTAIIILFVIKIYIFTALNKYKNITQDLVLIYIFMFLFFISSLNSSRPEVLITLLYVIILYLVIIMNKDNVYKFTSIIIVLIGLGLSTHQESTILIFSSLLILVKLNYLRPKIYFKDFFIIFIGISLAIQLIFIDGNIFWLIDSINRFTEAANIASPGRFLNNYPLYAEWMRPYHLYFSGLSTQAQIFMGTLFYFSLVYLIFMSTKLFFTPSLKYSPIHFISMAASLAPLGLFLNPIKWAWYYAPLYINILIAFFVLNSAQSNRLVNKGTYLQILAVGVSASLAFTYPWRANDFNWPLRSISLDELNDKFWFLFGDYRSTFTWILFTFFIVLLIYFLDKYNVKIGNLIYFAFNSFIISILIFIHMAPPIYDAIKNPSEWTFIRQSVLGLWDKEARCGLSASIKDSKTGISIQEILDKNQWSVISMPAPYIFIPCSRPVASEAGSWLMPDVSFGWVPIYAQGRLATMTNITQLGCDESLKTEDPAQRCFFRWESDIDTLPPYETTESLNPDYIKLLKINMN